MASRRPARQPIFWIVLVGFALLMWAVVRSNTRERTRDVTLTQFMDELEGDNIRQVTLTASNGSGMLDALGILRKNNELVRSTVPSDYPDLYRTLREKKVEVILDADSGRTWQAWFIYYLPFVLLLGMWVYFMRQLREGLRGYRPPPGPLAAGPPEK
ncbi:MAG: ATP-dependent metallopeptidase FtsH/Yme1/Tma family protein [Acidobacteriia bacterium]|nr:ATP-dependent metallopeptidase FtsH/Yme1/Tma family protein [Terriglobia bacterium]